MQPALMSVFVLRTQDYVAARRDPGTVGKTAQEVRAPQGYALRGLLFSRDQSLLWVAC